MSSSNPPIISLVSPGTINISNGSQLTVVKSLWSTLASRFQQSKPESKRKSAAPWSFGVYLGACIVGAHSLLLGVLGLTNIQDTKAGSTEKKVLIK